MEMDRVNEKNGIIRGYFKNFIESEKFRLIIDKMREEKIPIAEITCDGHLIKINDFYYSGKSGTHDSWEAEAEKYKKYFEVRITINGDSTNEISGHRIKNPDWWVLTAPPEDTTYLIASCWVNAHDFYDDYELLESIVENVLNSVDPDRLHSYEAINIPA